MVRAGSILAALWLLVVPGLAMAATNALPPIGHVFVIVLENEGAPMAFGPGSKAAYLSKTLVARGALLSNYYGIAHDSLGNYLAMISGQGVNPATQDDCETFAPFVQTGIAAYDQVIGRGCVYPKPVRTLADQLTRAGRSWKGYMEDMGADPAREADHCGHPAVGAPDNTQRAKPGDQYAARHDPFVYFRSVIDSPVCQQAVVPLSQLAIDLKAAATTPAYNFIVPNLCDDGHDGPEGEGCVDKAPSGFTAIDAFLRHWVPLIEASPAFRKDGLLIITFDEADMHHETDAATGKDLYIGDASACCGELPGPNLPARTSIEGMADQGPGIIGPGGGRVGAVALSPFIRPGTLSARPYNHYSLLRTVEDIFRLPHLGYAAQPSVHPMAGDVFTAWPRRN